MKNAALLHIYTLAVFILFCFSRRNNWQLKSVLSTQSENVLQMLQAFVRGSLDLEVEFVFLWMEGQCTLKKTERRLNINADHLARKKSPKM